MASLMIGCPIKDRGWIIDRWFKHVNVALSLCDDLDVSFVFVMPFGDPTAEYLYDRQEDIVLDFSEEIAESYVRRWNDEAYNRMVVARNQLLSIVRYYEPDYFLSLDSDILVNSPSLLCMFDCLDSTGADAVGGKVYMDEVGKSCPSNGVWADDSFKRFHRKNVDSMIPVDIIMAFKLMTPKAYNIDYSYHMFGEDLGWSLNAKKAGLKLYWDGGITSKHVMSRDWLDRVDKRCGY